MAIGYWLSDTVFDNTDDCTSMAVNSSASTDVVLNKKAIQINVLKTFNSPFKKIFN